MHPRFVRFVICVALLHAPAGFGAVRGIVFDAHGDPVSDARVTTHRCEPPAAQRARILAGTPRTPLDAATTDKSGTFSLDAKISGLLELSVDREGFAPARQLVLAGDENVVVNLRPATRRTGRVTANGKPVSGATVIAYLRASVAWTSRTADDGTYAMPDPKGWCSALVVVHPDYAPSSQGDEAGLDVALVAGTTVTGSVRNAGGRPVAKANVFAGPWTRAMTAEDGTFVLRHVAAEEKKIAAADGAAFGAISREAGNIVVVIEQLPSISGTVRDADQRPLEGVPVYAYAMSPQALSSALDANTTVTDGKGNYSLQHCLAVPYTVMAQGDASLEFATSSVSLRKARSARADLTAKKSDFIIGSVVDEQKHPIAGAVVQFTIQEMLMYGFATDTSEMPTAYSNGEGKFKLRRLEQLDASGIVVRLQALRRGYAAGMSEPLKREDAGRITIVLPDGIELAGLVKDAAGKPVAGAGVVVLQDPSGAVPLPVESVMSMGALRGFAESDAEGRFSIRLNPAPHDLGVWKEGYAGVRLGDVVPRHGAEPLNVVLESGVEIRGRVTSKSAIPSLAGTIWARGGDATLANTEVSEDGIFVIKALRPGAYTLKYQGENGRSAESEAQAPATGVTLDLPATGEIRGRVVDASTRAVLRSYSVHFGSESEVIDGEESFVLHPVPGSGEVTVTADGYVKGTAQVTVTADKPAEVTIALNRGRSVSGVVTDEQGQPVAAAWVNLSGEYEQMDHTTQNGEFHLDGVALEALTVEVTAARHLSRTIEVPAGDHDIDLNVVLSKGRSVSGHVFTSDGAPVAEASVSAMGDSSQDAKTDSSGAYVIEGLGDGPYTLYASRDELKSESVSLGSEVPRDLVLVMKPSAGAGRIHGVVKGFSGSAWNFGVIRTSPGDGHAIIGRDGTYTIERAPAGELELQAWAQSTRAEASTPPVKVTVIAGGDVEANLAFRDDVTIRGIVTDSGAPAPGRTVRFRSGMMRWSTAAGEGGAYQLVGIEPGVLYDVEVEGGSRSFTTRYQVTGSDTFDIHIEWSRIEGKAVDSTGVPVAGAKVSLSTPENHDSEEASTDESGAFSLPVARVPHVLTIVKEGFATFTQRVEARAAPLLVRMERTNGLRVRLVDARDGRTLNGYVVAVDPAGLPVARADEAQKDGTMLVPIRDGSYRISVSANGYASQSVRASLPYQGELKLALTPGGTLIVQTDRASADVVKLVLPNGEEYVRCQCNGIAEIRLTGTTTTIDHVAPGAYTMQVLDERGLVKASHPITVVEGQTTQAEIRVPE